MKQSKAQAFKVKEVKRSMASGGQVPIRELTDASGSVVLDYVAKQDSRVLFRITIDTKGRQATAYA